MGASRAGEFAPIFTPHLRGSIGGGSIGANEQIAAIDDANSELHAEFFPSESTLGCMKVLQNLICKNGIFKVLYVDKAGIFGGAKRFHFSQVSRACKELGIEIIFANSPEGKGRIERAFDTLQDRLIAELEIENINSMDEANHYLLKSCAKILLIS